MQQNNEKDILTAGFQAANVRTNQIEKAIQEEKEERIRHFNDQLKPILETLAHLDKAFAKEKVDREKKEVEIIKTIVSESKRVYNEIDNEKEERNKRITTLDYDTKHETKVLHNLRESFATKTQTEVHRVGDAIREEMDNRFEHQDKMVENLSNMVRTFQNTLKVLGDDV